MASDPTAGGAPAEMPVEPDDNLEIPAKPEAGELQQLQAEKAELQCGETNHRAGSGGGR